MFRGLAQSDRPVDAVHMYTEMREKGLNGDKFTFVFVFKACARVSDVINCQKFHAHALRLGVVTDLYVSNALIHVYSSCNGLSCARTVFDEMLKRDLVSWNSLICGYSQNSRFREVLGLFDTMKAENVKADATTIVKVIIACSQLGDLDYANTAVKYIQENYVEIDVYLGNTLIDLYGRYNLIESAKEVFNKMRERNIVSWNTMMMGYAKVGDLISARKLFDEMPNRDVISWTSMITCYSQSNQFSDALNLFAEMMAAKAKPDEITVATVLSACAHLGSLDVGEAIHDYICKYDVKTDVYVGNSLIDMYCKCGAVDKALKVFLEMQERDSVSWTSVIAGLAVNGSANSALHLFEQMLREGKLEPTHGTFVGILMACAHAGLVDKGLGYFALMRKVYKLEPEMKHYGCVVDLLSRSGNVERAYEFIKRMPKEPDTVVWRTMLSACKLHGKVELAEIASKKLTELGSFNSGNYILLSNMYAGAYRWDDAVKARDLMQERDVQKPRGRSSIEVDG